MPSKSARSPATTTDPAGKQIARFGDALGRLIEVDEPAYGSLAGKGSVTVSGIEQSRTFSTRYCVEFDGRGRCTAYEFDTSTVYDSGTVTITVNGHLTSA